MTGVIYQSTTQQSELDTPNLCSCGTLILTLIIPHYNYPFGSLSSQQTVSSLRYNCNLVILISPAPYIASQHIEEAQQNIVPC